METTLRVISEGLGNEELQVEYEIIPFETNEKIRDIDQQIELIQNEIDKYNAEIDRLTNHADGIDYAIAVASGIISGLIDSFFVGEFSLENAHEFGKDKTNKFVVKVAKSQGFRGSDDDVPGAIRYLSDYKKHKDGSRGYHLASDSVTSDFGGGLQHHLRDFAHHPTPVGLFFSMLTQFTEKAYGTDTTGNFLIVEVKNKTFIGKDLPQKVLFGFVYWIFHIISDMAGSGKLSEGTGLPGPVLSLLKEVSALPIFKDKKVAGIEFPMLVSKLFNGTLLDERFDLRTEIGIVKELSKQAIPVIINETLVRGAYFIRQLISELRSDNVNSMEDFKNINWKNTLPFKNRTIVRMLTISCATFTAFDIGDAAVRAVVNSGGVNPATASQFILRVNFVGVGRLVVAVGADVTMGVKRHRARRERMRLHSEQLHLLNAKVAYKQADMWVAAEDTEKAIKELYKTAEASFKYAAESIKAIEDDMEKIGECIESAEEKNPGLKEEMSEILFWG